MSKVYADIRQHVRKPIAERRELMIGRNKAKRVPRSMGLEAPEVKKLVAELEAGNKLPNPFNLGWNNILLETLKKLGLNKSHKLSTVEATFKELASDPATKNAEGQTYWQVFANKPNRNEKTGKDWEGRFEDNLKVAQRLGGLYPYGLKWLELGKKVLKTKGCVLEITQRGEEIMVCLNTDSNKPLNETKREVKAAKAKPAKKAKPVKVPGKRGRKPGSKNKPKETPVVAPVTEPVVEPVEPVVEPTPETPQETVIQPTVITEPEKIVVQEAMATEPEIKAEIV